MNQMYLNDIDLMKFEHSIRSDLDMFMIECYEDYYCEAEGAKEGIFQKIKRKIKEIFDKLKAMLKGTKTQQMDKNIEMAQKAVQNMSSEQKSKKVEVFDGEKALKLIEEDHEKAKKDPKHKRLDKKKIIALCTIPVTIGVAITILIKNKKTLPKILDKEQELNKEVEQAEKEAKKAEDEAWIERKSYMSRYRKQFSKEITDKNKWPRPSKSGRVLDRQNFPFRPNSMEYRKSWLDPKGDHCLVDSDDYKFKDLNDLQFIEISDITFNKGDFVEYTASVVSNSTNKYVGIYTLIFDKVTKTAKEIIDFGDSSNKSLKGYAQNLDPRYSKELDKYQPKYRSSITGKDMEFGPYTKIEH